MDLPVPNKDLNKRTLESVTSCAAQFSQESMSLASLVVRSREEAVPSCVPEAVNCNVSFNASWHRLEHYSNHCFAAAIDAVSNKVLDYVLYQRVYLYFAAKFRISLVLVYLYYNLGNTTKPTETEGLIIFEMY